MGKLRVELGIRNTTPSPLLKLDFLFFKHECRATHPHEIHSPPRVCCYNEADRHESSLRWILAYH